MYGIIYLLTSPSGKHYVGQTTLTFKQRWCRHVSYTKHGGKSCCTHLKRALLKYGPDSFQKDIIAECSDKSELDRLEKFWIALLKSNNRLYGYNLQTGGGNYKASDESKEKMRLAALNRTTPRYKFEKGHATWNKGKTTPEETRRKQSKVRLGKEPVNKGQPMSDEQKRKVSASKMGQKPWNAGIKSWQSGENHPMFGRHHSEEAKEKISLTKFIKTIAWG